MEAGISTHGQIVEVEGIGGPDGGAFYPVFEYQTEEGILLRDRGVGSSHPLYNVHKVYPVGTRVPVIYDPKNPGNAKIDAFMQTWAMPFFVSFFGLFFGFKIVRAGL